MYCHIRMLNKKNNLLNREGHVKGDRMIHLDETLQRVDWVLQFMFKDLGRLAHASMLTGFWDSFL